MEFDPKKFAFIISVMIYYYFRKSIPIEYISGLSKPVELLPFGAIKRRSENVFPPEVLASESNLSLATVIVVDIASKNPIELSTRRQEKMQIQLNNLLDDIFAYFEELELKMWYELEVYDYTRSGDAILVKNIGSHEDFEGRLKMKITFDYGTAAVVIPNIAFNFRYRGIFTKFMQVLAKSCVENRINYIIFEEVVNKTLMSSLTGPRYHGIQLYADARGNDKTILICPEYID